MGRALARRPEFLLLDEPAAGQDAEETERSAALLCSLAADGTAVVLVEHDMSLVMGVCDEVHVFDLGKVIAVGPPAEIRRDAAVLAAYLGDAGEAREGPAGAARRAPPTTGSPCCTAWTSASPRAR